MQSIDVKAILCIWTMISLIGWYIGINYYDAWDKKQLKVKHLIHAVLFLPVSLVLFILIALDHLNIIDRVKAFFNKDIT